MRKQPSWLQRGLQVVSLGFPLCALSLSIQAANLTDVNSLISQAVTTHPLVGAARAEEQATAEGITAAKLNLYPMPSVTSSYDKNDGMVTRAGIRQPLWTGGKLSANVNQAIYDDKAATAYIFEQQNTVAKNTIDIWQSYIYATALQSLYVNNLKQLNEFESMMQRRVAQGVSARIDLDLVTNRILQDQNAYQGAVQQQRIAEARLSQMIGEPIQGSGPQVVPLDQMARYVKAQSRDFERLAFGDAGFNNPSVVKQQYQIEAAKQQVKAQEAAKYPSIYAQYEQLYYHKDNESDGNFSLGLSYDPGAGFSNYALARASQARVQSLAQSQEAARRTVMEDIQTQYQQFVSAKDQETSLIAAVAGAQIVVDSYRRQFIAGRKTWLEVLNAVREKAGYQQQLLQVQSQMLGAFYKLQVDFGRMPWQNFSPMTAPVKEYHPYLEFRDWLKKETQQLTNDPQPFIFAPESLEPAESTQGATDNSVVAMLPVYQLLPDTLTESALDEVALRQDVTSKSTVIMPTLDVPNIESRWLKGDTIIYPSLDKVVAQSFGQYASPKQATPHATDEQQTQEAAIIQAVAQHYASHLPRQDGFSRYPEMSAPLQAAQPTKQPNSHSEQTTLQPVGYQTAQKTVAQPYAAYQAKAQDTAEAMASEGFNRYPEPNAMIQAGKQSQPQSLTITETRQFLTQNDA